ncbi:MAG: hypothetical protein A2156_01740 [Deltaproteobacteria bacterium RBG_16_48_10]|nr:MAG: hypothetical protein A2156_01740 [Deltaproteobacteria bacterium RBG_16_48_10]
MIVHYVNPSTEIHPWRRRDPIRFRCRYFKPLFGIDWKILKYALDEKNGFVIAGWSSFSLIALIALVALLKRPFIFWTDTPDVKRSRTFVKKLLRLVVSNMVFGSATAVMGTGKPGIDALQAMGCPSSKLVCFPFFVNLDVLKRMDEKGTNSRRDGKIIFASSGRLEINLKGYDIALKSLSRARDLSGNNNFEYHLAGAGPDEERLKNLAANLNLVDQVRFRGWLESNELVELLRRCDVFIHPALRDPFPVAVLEAMAAGMVVLGSDASGSVRDRIVNGVNGFVHSPGNVQQLADQIANLMKNPGSISMIGERARQAAEQWPASRGVTILESILSKYS